MLKNGTQRLGIGLIIHCYELFGLREQCAECARLKIEEFRKLIREEFGEGLKHATPANVREFLDKMEGRVLPDSVTNRIVIDEPCNSYEEVIRDFFSHILDLPPEEAIVALWSLSLYLAFTAIENQYAEQFASLFKDID